MAKPQPEPRRLTLLYQLYVTNHASRRFMRLVLDGAALSSEEFAVLSYLHANGPRTLSQASRDLGLPVTTLATTLGPVVEAGLVDRTPHPRDRRARLLAISERGRGDLVATLPSFSEAYTTLIDGLQRDGADIESMFETISTLRTQIERSCDRLEDRAAEHARATTAP